MRSSLRVSHRFFPPPHSATASPGRQLPPFRRQWECSTKIVPWFRQASFWKEDPLLQTMTERVHTFKQALRTFNISPWKNCNNKLQINGFFLILFFFSIFSLNVFLVKTYKCNIQTPKICGKFNKFNKLHTWSNLCSHLGLTLLQPFEIHVFTRHFVNFSYISARTDLSWLWTKRTNSQRDEKGPD